MSKAYRCDNPMCREFFDPYELQDQYSTIEVTLHNRENNKPMYYTFTPVESNCCTSANSLGIQAKPTYCLCPRCTYTLKELIGMN